VNRQLKMEILSDGEDFHKESSAGLTPVEKELPEGWKWVRLENVLSDIQPGFACGAKSKSEGLPHLRMNNIGIDGKIDLSLLWHAPFEKREMTNYLLRAGDVIFNNTNSPELVGKTAVFDIRDGTYVFSNHLTRLRPISSRLLPGWLAICLRYLWHARYFERYCTQWVNQAAFNKRKLLKLKIPVPPVREQTRIVATAEAISSRVAEAKKLREEALSDADAIMQSALHEVFSRAEEKGWEWRTLSSVCKIDSESRNPSIIAPEEQFIYIDISGIESGTGKIREVKRIFGRDAPSRARKVVHTDDVIMSTVRPYLKSFAIISEDYNNQICSTGFAVLSCMQGLFPRYLLYVLFWDNTIEQCNKMMVGAHYPALNSMQVAQIRIHVPPLEEQKRIVMYLDKLQEKVEALKRQQRETGEELEALSAAVLEEAFRGRL